MVFRLASRVLLLATFAGVAGLMLVPTGMCVCSDADDESPTGQHEPGCPKVRKLERSAAPEHYAGDSTAGPCLTLTDDVRPDGPADSVPAVGHGPPRGHPLYLALQTLLI